jgi:hypothetical protein
MTSGGAIGQANAFFGNVVKLAFVLLLGGGGWLGWQLWHATETNARELAKRDADLTAARSDLAAKTKEAERLAADVAQKQRRIDELELARKYLKLDQRVARLVVLDQTPPSTTSRGSTRLRFEEVDANGDPIGAGKELTIEGDVVYVDSWVVKFEDLFVEQHEALRSASLVLFRRLFGEHQAPSDGVAIDPPDRRPAVYGGDTAMNALEAELWQKFWELSNDPKQAAKLGVRAAHGEAPSQKLKKGEVYVVTRRASGGLTIQPDRPSPGAR